MIEETRCPICHSSNLTDYTSKNQFNLLRCTSCAFVFVAHVTAEHIDGFYEEEYFKPGNPRCFSAPSFTWDMLFNKRWACENFLSEKGFDRYLEIGPSPSGGIIKFFHKDKKIEYVEISEYATEVLVKSGFTVAAPTIEALASSERANNAYDVIVALEVIEHCIDPMAFLASSFKCLRPNGRVFFSTGNIDSIIATRKKDRWFYIDPPAHVSYFNHKNMQLALLKTGFKNVKIRRYGFNWVELFGKYKLLFLLPYLSALNPGSGMLITAEK